MLTEQELLCLLRDLESDRAERTIATRDTDKFAQAICAFANDFPSHRQPGYLMVGVHDDGRPCGLRVTDERRFSGDLLTVLRELDAFIGTRVPSRPVVSSALREGREDEYPVVALRELLLNAVMHRAYESTAPIRFYWYSGRVEIQNAGGLYGEATPENFPRQTAYRNPIVAEAMKSLGYVNKYGRGVIRTQEALSKNGNPPPEFTFETTYFLATIRSRP